MRKEKNYPLAIQYYQQAIHYNKIDHEVYANLANVYFDLQKPDSAFLYYQKALGLKADYYPALDNMAAMFAVIGRYDSSLVYDSLALKIKPDYAVAYRNSGFTHLQLRMYEKAIYDFEKYLQYSSDSELDARADAYSDIGISYQGLGKYQESLAPINKAIEMTGSPVYFLNRSYSYNGLKNMEQARADALTAKQKGIKIPDDYARTLGIQ